jgi:hypothetical protein
VYGGGGEGGRRRGAARAGAEGELRRDWRNWHHCPGVLLYLSSQTTCLIRCEQLNMHSSRLAQAEAAEWHPLTLASYCRSWHKTVVVQITRDMYQAFKKHVEEQDQLRVERLNAAAPAATTTVAVAATANACPPCAAAAPAAAAAARPCKVARLPALGRVLAHACQLLLLHVQTESCYQTEVNSAFHEFQTVSAPLPMSVVLFCEEMTAV